MLSKQLYFFIFLVISITSCSKNTSQKETFEAESLFKEGATNWFKGGDTKWTTLNNTLIGDADSSAGFVMSQKTYGDFELNFEFFPDSTINSGVYLRCSENIISPKSCYEINIWDLHPNQKNRTGAVVGRTEPLNFVETNYKWNSYRIKCRANKLEAWINNIKTVDLENDELSKGYIALQATGNGRIRFKNVRVKPLY